VTGEADTADGERHAFLWDGTTMRDLGTLAAGKLSQAYAINALGQVTGVSDIESTQDLNRVHAFVSSGGLMQDLNSLVDPDDPLAANVTLFYGVDINRRGQILAVGENSQEGVSKGYLATPLEYQIRFLEPAAGSRWFEFSVVPVRVKLVDVNGRRITDARASSIANSCRMKLSVATIPPETKCMTYNATTNEFYSDWVATPERRTVTLEVAATYKFSMPQTVTTTQSRGIYVPLI